MVDENGLWRVMRQDDNGNRFVVTSELTEEHASRLAQEVTERGYKQMYWADRFSDHDR